MEDKVLKEEIETKLEETEEEYSYPLDEEDELDEVSDSSILPVILVGGALVAATFGAVKGVKHLIKKHREKKNVVSTDDEEYQNAEDADYEEVSDDDSEEDEKTEADDD